MAQKNASKAVQTRLRIPPAAAGLLAGCTALLGAQSAGAQELDVVPAGGVASERPSIAAPVRPSTPIPQRGAVENIPETEGPLKLSGYFWVDTGLMDRKSGQPGTYDQNANFMQGRMVVAATHQRQFGDFFGRARVEFLGLVNEKSKGQYEAHTLDAYVMAGGNTWDVQVGRFLPWEVYHRGLGIDLFTPEEAGAQGGPSLYWLNSTYTYFDEAGQAAAHFYPFEWLGFELAGVYGQQNNGQNFTGVRPTVAFNYGGLQALAGWEMLAQRPQTEADKVETTSDGWAARLQYDFPWLTIGVNYAQGTVESLRIQGDIDSEKSMDKWSAGAFANVHFLDGHTIGLGYHHTDQFNGQKETNLHDQAFVAYQYRLPFIEGMSLKAVYGWARADLEDIDNGAFWLNDMQSFRVRIAYDLM